MQSIFIFSEEKADIEMMKPEQFASLERIKQSIRKDQEQVSIFLRKQREVMTNEKQEKSAFWIIIG